MYAKYELAAHPFERTDPKLEIAVFDLRIERLPILIKQSAERLEAGEEARETVAAQQGFGHPRRELQILCLLAQQIRSHRDHAIPIGDLSSALITAGQCDVFAPLFLERIERRIVAQVATCGVITRNRRQQCSEQFGIEWHTEREWGKNGASRHIGTTVAQPSWRATAGSGVDQQFPKIDERHKAVVNAEQFLANRREISRRQLFPVGSSSKP